MTNGSLMKVKSIAECSTSAVLRIEIHILSLHLVMKNISYFNVFEAPRASQKH